MSDHRVSWAEFNPIAKLINVAWAQFDTQASTVDTRVSWAQFNTLGSQVSHSGVVRLWLMELYEQEERERKEKEKKEAVKEEAFKPTTKVEETEDGGAIVVPLEGKPVKKAKKKVVRREEKVARPSAPAIRISPRKVEETFGVAIYLQLTQVFIQQLFVDFQPVLVAAEAANEEREEEDLLLLLAAA